MPFAQVQTANGCMLKGLAHPMRKYTPQEQIEVFWANVIITADDNLCWLR